MEHSCSYLQLTAFTPPLASFGYMPSIPLPAAKAAVPGRRVSLLQPAALKSPRGFGSPPRKSKQKKKRTPMKEEEDSEDDDDRDGDSAADGTIPEIVTNRMMTRMGFSVGIPLALGLLFFPFFYYLKVAAKVDVPTWVPVIVSFFFFGSALLGVSYGIVSSSWDPLREGSLLGWKEAQKNWPVFWQSLWGRSGKK